MSAFMVAEKTINRVLSHIVNTRENRDWTIRKLNAAMETSYASATPAFCQKLVDEMAKLNRSSVNQRYDEIAPVPEYHYRYELVDHFQALKSLRCFLYQSCEGNCEETALYKALGSIADDWALSIVSNLPQYDKAEWD